MASSGIVSVPTASISASRAGRGALRLLPFAAALLLLAGCAAAPRAVPPVEREAPSARPPAAPPPAGVPPPGERPAPPPPAVPPSSPARAVAPQRFVRVLLSAEGRSLVLEGETVRAWDVDGNLAAEGAGRVTVAAVGSRIRWNGSMLLGETIDAGGNPQLRVSGRDAGGRIRVSARKGELIVVAVVPLEAYVASVVSREAAPRFHPEALAALAVAVRTYAAAAAAKPKDPSYDVVGTVEDQVFDGVDGVGPAFLEAAARTRGLTLRYGGGYAQAVYHSTCGGWTESAASAWGKDVPYLRPLRCDDCRDSPVYRWEYRMTAAEGRRLAQMHGVPPGADLRFSVVGRTATGRAIRVRIASGGVAREVQAATFRKAAGYAKIRSLKMDIVSAGGGFRFSGEGYGHGVGMCQFGADGMARRGEGFAAILARYYPGTSLAGDSR